MTEVSVKELRGFKKTYKVNKLTGEYEKLNCKSIGGGKVRDRAGIIYEEKGNDRYLFVKKMPIDRVQVFDYPRASFDRNKKFN